MNSVASYVIFVLLSWILACHIYEFLGKIGINGFRFVTQVDSSHMRLVVCNFFRVEKCPIERILFTFVTRHESTLFHWIVAKASNCEHVDQTWISCRVKLVRTKSILVTLIRKINICEVLSQRPQICVHPMLCRIDSFKIEG